MSNSDAVRERRFRRAGPGSVLGDGDFGGEARLAGVDDETLVSRARTGDRSAAELYFARHLRFLAAMSRRLSMQVVDPDDLLAEAISRLLRQWANGNGPHENVNAYLIASMRNGVTSALRSPRSRERAFDELAEPAAEPESAARAAELHREFARVRQAIARLPQDQQTILQGVVVEGRKPAEMAELMERSPTGVYNLLLRAKKGLRRSLLEVILAEDAPSDCTQHGNLPAEVYDELDDPRMTGSRMEHIRGCQRCRAAWLGFAATASALGVAALLVIGNPLSAPAAYADTTHQGSSDRSTTRSLGKTTRRVVRALGPARTVLAGLGAASTLAAAGTLVALGSASVPSNPYATIQAEAAVGSGSTTLSFRLAVDASRWRATALNLRLTGTTLIRAPDTWSCKTSGTTTRCSTTRPNSAAGVFQLAPATAETAAYQLDITATTDNTTVHGNASGPLTS